MRSVVNFIENLPAVLSNIKGKRTHKNRYNKKKIKLLIFYKRKKKEKKDEI